LGGGEYGNSGRVVVAAADRAAGPVVECFGGGAHDGRGEVGVQQAVRPGGQVVGGHSVFTLGVEFSLYSGTARSCIQRGGAYILYAL
jgi:hypothetical protein